MNEENQNEQQNNNQELENALNNTISNNKSINNSTSKEEVKPKENTTEIKPENNKNTENQEDENMLETILNNDVEPPKKEIFSINISSFDDIIKIFLNNEYESVDIIPLVEKVQIIFKKWWIDVDEKVITYPLYSNILIQIKNIIKLDSDFKKPQEWTWKYKFDKKDYIVNIKTDPENYWEKITMKILPKTSSPKSISNLFTFIWALWIILFILWAVSITFIVLNAKTVQDVMFFNSLWISLNNINKFIAFIVKIVFSLLLVIEMWLFVIAGTKFLLTKKEFKKKRFILWIVSAFLLFLSLFTWTLWLAVNKKVNNLPNRQEMSYWDIQLYDNTKLLLTDLYSKWDALISSDDYWSLIWPITIKFDLTYYQKEQENKWYQIEKYIWDFWDWDTEEVITPTIIKEFTEKRTYNIQVTAQIKQVDWSIKSEQVDNIPSIWIKNLVKITETTTDSWWKKVVFDASDLAELWQIEWFSDDDNFSTPILTWSKFIPSKIIFKDTLFWLYIVQDGKTSTELDKIFKITWLSSDEWSISWSINSTRWDDDLTYEFSIADLKLGDSNWFIENFKWIIDWDEKTLTNDIWNEEESSKIKYTFSSYWKKTIKLILTDSYWKTKEIDKTIDVTEDTKLWSSLSIYDDGDLLTPRYENNIYYIQNLAIPTTLKFDANLVKTENTFDSLQEVSWSTSDWKKSTWNVFEYEIDTEWNTTINVTYTFENIKTSAISTVNEKIYIESVKKDVLLDLEISPSTETYVPAVIQFDASKSQIKNENIVKFIYDYWDWSVPEERDAVNLWHEYTVAWTYTVTLTAVTASWNKYSISKNIVLKAQPQSAKITTSLKEAPVGQWIDFSSDESNWQISSYFWDFGDWETSTEANPSHTYETAWTYTVKLKLSFSNNNILTDTIDVNITSN